MPLCDIKIPPCYKKATIFSLYFNEKILLLLKREKGIIIKKGGPKRRKLSMWKFRAGTKHGNFCFKIGNAKHKAKKWK